MNVRRISRLRQVPPSILTLLTVVTLLLALRISNAVDAGVDGVVVMRTYLFWAMVCAPVAYLGDILLQTMLDYRVVRLAVARVQSRD